MVGTKQGASDCERIEREVGESVQRCMTQIYGFPWKKFSLAKGSHETYPWDSTEIRGDSAEIREGIRGMISPESGAHNFRN